MLGYDSSEEVMALPVQAFYCQPADRDSIIGRLREQKFLAQQEICLRRKDGGPAWILANMNLVDAEGEAGAATIIGTSFDISERKRSREALKQSQQRFEAFMRHLPGVAFMKNREGHYVYYNEAAQGLFQLDPEDFLGKTDYEVWPVEYAERFVSNDREVMRTKTLVETVDPVPHKHAAITGWLPVSHSDEHEEVQFIGGVGRHTERRQLEDQLAIAKNGHRALAGGSRTANNLLTVISGYGPMMRDLPRRPAAQLRKKCSRPPAAPPASPTSRGFLAAPSHPAEDWI
jgi:PAS domain-containing protein